MNLFYSLDLSLAFNHRKAGVNLEYLLWNQLGFSECIQEQNLTQGPKASFTEQETFGLAAGGKGCGSWPAFLPKKWCQAHQQIPLGIQHHGK